MLWFTQSAELTPDLANLVKLLLRLPAIGLATFFGLAGIGVLLIVSGILITLNDGWERKKGVILEEEEEEEVNTERKNSTDEED
jgi:hypothetical protein